MHNQDYRKKDDNSPANWCALSFETICIGLKDENEDLTHYHAGFLNDLFDIFRSFFERLRFHYNDDECKRREKDQDALSLRSFVNEDDK